VSQAIVLVVDDSPTQLRRTSSLLRDAGYTVTTACDGDEALHVANQHTLDAIVLDIILPKKNGYQVCRQLKTDPRHKEVKILLLSTKNHDSDKTWGEKQGADAYITKPFDDDQLLAAVRNMLHGNFVGNDASSHRDRECIRPQDSRYDLERESGDV
jgi:twitching motility two-component system response regulator PilH